MAPTKKTVRRAARPAPRKRAKAPARKPAHDKSEHNVEFFKWFTHPYVETVFGGTFHPGGLSLTETLAARAEIRASDRVLDIGSGTGATAVRLAHRVGCRFDGIEPLEELIPTAVARAEREGLTGQVVFTKGVGESLPWPDGSFQVVMLESTYIFLVEPKKVLTEAFRVLAGNGRIAIIDLAVAPGAASTDRKSLLRRIGLDVRPGTEAEYRKALSGVGFLDIVWTDETRTLVKYLRDLRSKLALAKMVQLSLPPELRSLDLDAIQESLDLGIALGERGEVILGTLIAKKAARAR
ncbi:MAG: class I SAM-dependent methyltransferase [bacterium]